MFTGRYRKTPGPSTPTKLVKSNTKARYIKDQGRQVFLGGPLLELNADHIEKLPLSTDASLPVLEYKPVTYDQSGDSLGWSSGYSEFRVIS